MSRNRSLDEFVPEESGEPVDGGDDPSKPDGSEVSTPDEESSTPDEGEDRSIPDGADPDRDPGSEPGGVEATVDGVDPARSTLAWSPGRSDCEACDRAVSLRWRDGDRLVCADCKEW